MRWLTRTMTTLTLSWGFVIGAILIGIGNVMEDFDTLEGAAFIPGGTGGIIWLVSFAAWIADRVDRKRQGRPPRPSWWWWTASETETGRPVEDVER